MKTIKKFNDFFLNEDYFPGDDEQVELTADKDACTKCDCENCETCECPKCECPKCLSNKRYKRKATYEGPRRKVVDDEIVESKKSKSKTKKLNENHEDSLIERVLEQIKTDVYEDDVTAIEEMLNVIPEEVLIAYLPESKQG